MGDAVPDELLGSPLCACTVLPCQASGGDLDDHAIVDKPLQTLWPTLKFDVSFRMGQYWHEPLCKEPPDYVLYIGRSPVERWLHQQKRGPVKSDRTLSVDEVGQ